MRLSWQRATRIWFPIVLWRKWWRKFLIYINWIWRPRRPISWSLTPRCRVTFPFGMTRGLSSFNPLSSILRHTHPGIYLIYPKLAIDLIVKLVKNYPTIRLGIFFRVSQNMRKWEKCVTFILFFSHYLRFKKHSYK